MAVTNAGRVKTMDHRRSWETASISDALYFLDVRFLSLAIKNVIFVTYMDRLIGIDYGRRRTGLAASDPLRIFASALDTVDWVIR